MKMKHKGVLMWLNSHKKHLVSNEEYAMAEVIDDAIEIINLHTPEKPKVDSYGSSYAIFCPNCNEEIGKNDSICKNCTKLIDWSDSDDEK